jgi:outer membrane protein
MRTWFVLGFFAAALIAAVAPASAQQMRIGYLDSRRVLQEAPGAAEARQAIEQEMASLQRQMSMLDDTLRRAIEDFQARQMTLTADARRTEEQRLQAKRTELTARAQQIELEASRKQDELMSPVMGRVEQAIEEIRREGGYAIIFDLGAGAIVSADTTLDLTAQVIARLRGTAGAAAGRNDP